MKAWLALVGLACLAFGEDARAQSPTPPPACPEAAQPAGPFPKPAEVMPAPGCAIGGSLPSPGCAGGECLPAACGESPCGPPGRVWAEADYLLWWMKGASLPPLVTTSPAGTPQARAGVLGVPGTVVLFGGSDVNADLHSGGRFTLGTWLDDSQRFGIEGDYFLLESKAAGFSASSGGNPILARPFFDVLSNRAASELVALPGLSTGSVSATASSTGLVGADALLSANLCCGCNYRLDAIGGYRFLRLADRLGITEDLTSTGPPGTTGAPVGTAIEVADRFDTVNEFHGFDLGLRGEVRDGPWILQGRAQMAVGNNHEVLDVNGATTVTEPGMAPVTRPGGLLALDSNVGQLSRDRTVVIPEFGVKVGYQVTPCLRVCAGYSLLYWGEVARAGSQLDLNVNPRLLPPVTEPVGPLRPAPRFEESNFWAQGIDVGVELRY
jgi:Putative beta barrel porin-7 (BBP7)